MVQSCNLYRRGQGPYWNLLGNSFKCYFLSFFQVAFLLGVGQKSYLCWVKCFMKTAAVDSETFLQSAPFMNTGSYGKRVFVLAGNIQAYLFFVIPYPLSGGSLTFAILYF